MSMDFTKDRLEMEAREAKVRDWLDKLDAQRKAEQAAEQARLETREAFAQAKEAILGETEFAGYGFTVDLPEGVLMPGQGERAVTETEQRVEWQYPAGSVLLSDASQAAITEAVAAIADAPPEAPDASDDPEMGCDEAEAVEAVLSDREGAQ